MEHEEHDPESENSIEPESKDLDAYIGNLTFCVFEESHKIALQNRSQQ